VLREQVKIKKAKIKKYVLASLRFSWKAGQQFIA